MLRFPTNDPAPGDNNFLALLQALLDPVDPTLIDPYSTVVTEMLRGISERQPIGDRSAGVLEETPSAPLRGGTASRSVPSPVRQSTVTAPNRGFMVELLPGISIPIGVQLPQGMPTQSMPSRGQRNEAQDLFMRDQMLRRSPFNNFGGILPNGGLY